MRSSIVLVVSFLLASTAQAQVLYDAGSAGNPPVAPSPTTQGWSESLTGACSVTDVSPDPDVPINAWQITDPGAGRVLYAGHYSPWGDVYQAEITARILSGELYVDIEAGYFLQDNVFWLTLRKVGADVQLSRAGSSAVILTFPGGGTGYHTYNFRSGPNWNWAEVRFDGELVGTVGFSAYGWAAWMEGLAWGTQDGTSGDVRVHRAWMGSDSPCDSQTAIYCTAKVNSQGCTPIIWWTGSPSASHATAFRIWGSNVLNNRFGILIYSTSGSAATPFQGGTLCLLSPIRRSPGISSGGNPPPDDCSGEFAFEFNDYIATGFDPNLVQGQRVWAQYWYRDAASSSGTGLTNALTFVICQ